MRKKPTPTVRVNKNLQTVVGRLRIRKSIKSLACPEVIDHELDAAYQQIAQDDAREAEAREWAEATVGIVAAESP